MHKAPLRTQQQMGWEMKSLFIMSTNVVSRSPCGEAPYLQSVQIFTQKGSKLTEKFITTWSVNSRTGGNTVKQNSPPGIKYHWHVNRSSFPYPNAQIVRINTIGTQTERVTTVSRLPINYHCHQSVVVDMVLSTSKLRNEAPKDDHQRTSSDIVHPAVGKRATNHRWYGEYQAGLITVCIQWPYCWRYHLD